MDSHLFQLFSDKASTFLKGSLLEKIQEPQRGLLTFSLFNKGEKKQFVFRYGKQTPFCFLTGLRLPAERHPSAQIMRLRKYLAQRRIAAAVFQILERRLWLMPSGQGQEDGRNPWLCLDFAKGPALFFLGDDEVPQSHSPVWPEPAQLPEALENWRNWPVLTPALRKTLLKLDYPDQLALLADLQDGGGDIFLYKKPAGDAIVQISPWPLADTQAQDLTEEIHENILDAFEAAGRDLVLPNLYKDRDLELAERLKKKRRYLERLLANLDNDKKRLLSMAAGENSARQIQGFLWKLDGHAHVEKLELPDGQEIDLDKRFSILENMQRLFKGASRGKRGLKAVSDRRASLLQELENIEPSIRGKKETDASEAEKKSASIFSDRPFPKDAAVFRSSDGFTLLRGKNSHGNAAIRRAAAPHDLWAHVEQGQGAHVIIRRQYPGQEIPETTLDEAGTLAANKSWLSHGDKAAVMYAEVRHVKPIRKAGTGNVAIDRLAFTRLVPVDESLETKLVPGS